MIDLLTKSLLYRGRRRVCIVFCATAILALSLRLVQPTFPYLVLSHIFSGMASSMQHSVLEAWYVAEHHTQHLPSEWVAQTFATGAFLNGIVAILAGMVANAVVDTWGLWTPFALAILLLAIAGCMMMTTWEENYGKSKNGSIQLVDTLVDGLHVLWNGMHYMQEEWFHHVADSGLLFGRFKHPDTWCSTNCFRMCHVHFCTFVHTGDRECAQPSW